MPRHYVPYDESDIHQIQSPTTLASIKHNVLYKIDLPINTITEEGMHAISDFVYGLNLNGFRWPEWWSWEWVVAKDTSGNKCVGTFPKRLARYLSKAHGYKMKSEELASLGNIARSHTIETNTLLFDLTPKFNWSSGDFGDGHSCYWGDYSHSRTQVLPGLSALALRFYATEPEVYDIESWVRTKLSHWRWYCPERGREVNIREVGFLSDHPCNCESCLRYRRRFVENQETSDLEYGKGVYAKYKVGIKPAYRGIGRAWVVPNKDSELLFLFNAYGPYQSLPAARLLATILGLSYKRTRLEVEPDGALYLNGDAFVLGPDEDLKTEYLLDAGDYYSDYPWICDNCGEGIGDDDVYWSPNADTPYCYSCHDQLFSSCDDCGNTFYYGDLYLVDSESLCERCLEDTYYCPECSEYHREPCAEHYCDTCEEHFEDLTGHLSEEHNEGDDDAD